MYVMPDVMKNDVFHMFSLSSPLLPACFTLSFVKTLLGVDVSFICSAIWLDLFDKLNIKGVFFTWHALLPVVYGCSGMTMNRITSLLNLSSFGGFCLKLQSSDVV